jgi:predicted lipid-binding transport protein (Tim44 family)
MDRQSLPLPAAQAAVLAWVACFQPSTQGVGAMLAQMMNDEMMGGGMMAACMIGGTLLVVAVLVILVIQTILQKRILTELRRLNEKP